ncbi:MAG TPA: VWA domain-containing protein [Acidimicrobiales bacterium]|nr:VWA domain-containing protein [Acidimicrobiales bacterium]
MARASLLAPPRSTPAYAAPIDGSTDLASLAAAFGRELGDAGLAVTPDRVARFAAAISVAAPVTVDDLYWCARVTLVSRHADLAAFDRVFARVFRGMGDIAERRGDPSSPPLTSARTRPRPASGTAGAARQAAGGAGVPSATEGDDAATSTRQVATAVATAAERLAHADFAALADDELAELRRLMRQLAIEPPTRVGRRHVRHRRGTDLDLRATLRRSRRTAGDPVEHTRTRARRRPRRIVVLCDISGSMQPYARAYLQFLHVARGAGRADVFTFATRLTRLTRALDATDPSVALARASAAAPDWHGGTRIADGIKAFLDGFGRRGAARGAVVVVVSDGWETGDPTALAEQMARLARLAHRVVWVNPRAADDRYQPLAGGMAAALPYCDALVSGHSMAALGRVVAEIARA